MDLHNLTVNKDTLNKVNDYYISLGNITLFPTEIYIFLLNIKRNGINFHDIKFSKIKLLLTLGIEAIIEDSNNIDILIYALDNKFILFDDVFIYMCHSKKIKFIKYLLSIHENLDTKTKNKALSEALYYTNLNVVNLLLTEYNYDKYELSEHLYNFTVNFSAEGNSDDLEVPKIIDLLVKNGADINFDDGIVLKLILGWDKPKYDLTEFILNLGANPNNISERIILNLKKNKQDEILDLLEKYK